MKRFLVLAVLFWLPACVTAQTRAPVAAVPETPCPGGAEAWSLHLKALIDPEIGDADRYRFCAARAGHLEAMTALGSQLAQRPQKPGDFDMGMDFLRKAAIAGDGAAQRLLAAKYETGKIENGKNWIGRNGYLALFWDGIAHRDDRTSRQVPGGADFLGRFHERLSEDTRRTLAGQIDAWRPGRAEPGNFTFDILMTRIIANQPGSTTASERTTATAVLDYGLSSDLPDAGLLALFRVYNSDVDRVPEKLMDNLVARGSFLALTLKLRSVSAQKGRESEEADLILQLFGRVGLDIRYLQPRHEKLLTRFTESGDIDGLMRSIVDASPPERQILATIAAMNACSEALMHLCTGTLEVLKPLITPVALNFLTFIKAMEECRVPSKKLSCLLGNGGLTVLRDIIVNDTVDLGGRSV